MKKGEEWEPHTSQPSPSPLPQFGHTPQLKWSGNKTDGFIDFHDMEWPVGEILTLFKNN